ncbi:uncharacterized protein [Eurosta solidaginis]|uniref:uncharacterized protein n=1 Tax=Eurosta solidaginis TaxID=178769 RepID=UPI003530C6A9
MNIEQQKYAVQSAPSAALLNDSGYTNGYSTPSSSSLTTTSAGASVSSPTSETITYANIPIIPHGQLPTSTSPPLPPPPSTITMMGSASSCVGGTTSFKTPLLPMPTLEDIEGGLLAANGVSNSTPAYMPVGILKYPSAASAAAAASVAATPLSLPPPTPSMCGSGIGPGPPNGSPTLPKPPTLTLPASAATSNYFTDTDMPASHAQTQPQQLTPPATLAYSSELLQHTTTTTPVAVLSMQHSTQQTLQQPPPPSVGLLKSGSGVTLGVSSSVNMGSALGSHPSGHGSGMGNSATSGADTKRSTKCCCCFGNGSSSSSTKPQQKKRRKQKAQSIWSAMITNLGICALLLAYTLLGSFIFLTIENEDSTFLHHHHHHYSHHAVLQRQRQQLQQQQQRTLPSTKRGNGGNVENIYHTSPEQMHVDNCTALSPPNTFSSHSSSSSSSSASSSSSTSTLASLSGATYSAAGGPSTLLEGIVPLNDEENGITGSVDFGHADEFGASNSDGVSSAHLALSADTQEVRQRTIENIWDITVSLNILYKENWTKLAALEIAKFQDQLIKRLNEDALLQLSHEMDGSIAGGGGNGAAIAGNSPATEAVLLHTHGGHGQGPHEWNFAKAFLYSLTVLTTIGYGNIAPRTTLGRLVTLVYAIFGIPLTLVYLSSTGGILAKVAREVFSKALCCCLCSNCGYCCYDEKRMAEKERRMKRKRQQEELRKQQAALQEPYYLHDSFQSSEKQSNLASGTQILPPDIDSLSASESRGSIHGLSILAPILLCLSMMVIYILIGAVVLYRLEDWPILDGIYFCFMSLSTIGFGDMLPGLKRESTTTTWFCSIYIMSGMALTAMCFNVIHEEIVHRIKIVVEFKKGLDTMADEPGYYMQP